MELSMISYKPTVCTQEVLESIKELDDTFFETSLELDWYKDRYLNKGGCILLLDDDQIIGYSLVVPVNKILYKTLRRGIVTGDIDLDTTLFVNKSKYYYFASIVIRPEYRGQGFGTLLTNISFCYYHLKHWCAIVVSNAGAKLLDKKTSKFKIVNDRVIYYK